MTKEKKLKYGFHYTWKDILPRSEVIVVYATDLEDARTLVRAKVKELYPDNKPGCHWITMPQDYEKQKLAETPQIRQQSIWPTSLTIKLLPLLILTMVVVVLILLTSCNVDRFIQCNKNFRKKITQYEQRLTGAQYYYLEAIPPAPSPKE